MTDEKKPTTPPAEGKPAAPAGDNPAAKPKPAAPKPPAIVEQERTAPSEDWQRAVLDVLGPRVSDSYVASGEFTVVVENGEAFLTGMQALKEAGFDYLSDISSVDYSCFEGAPKPFGLSYHLYSVADNHRLRVKVFLEDGEAVPSVMQIWSTADFHEREAWDLMGIPFSGRGEVRRILMPEDWDGHPLRKGLAKNAGNEAYTGRMVRKMNEDA